MASASPFHVEWTVQTRVLPKFGGTAKFGVRGNWGWVMSTLAVSANALEFAVAGGCKHKGFYDGNFGDFQERNVKLGVDLDVLGLV